jgi:hypothetical protein
MEHMTSHHGQVHNCETEGSVKGRMYHQDVLRDKKTIKKMHLLYLYIQISMTRV